MQSCQVKEGEDAELLTEEGEDGEGKDGELQNKRRGDSELLSESGSRWRASK